MSTELQEYISDFRKACVEWGEAKTDDNHARMLEEQRALFSLIEKGGVSRTEPALTDRQIAGIAGCIVAPNDRLWNLYFARAILVATKGQS